MTTSLNETELQRAMARVDYATGLALQADCATAARELAQIPTGLLDEERAAYRDNMLRRFGPDGAAPVEFDVEDPWVLALVKAYVKYWQHALTHSDPAEGEAGLLADLGDLLGHSLDGDEALDAAEAEIHAGAAQRGFYVLLGLTPPLFELMLWKNQTVAEETVRLPGGPVQVKVTYLNDFVLRGWGHYATCGRRSAAGWTTEDGLFAVVPAYRSLEDEKFAVHFLGHEAQHFADKRAYGKLENWELEYRAKLTELSLADATQADTIRRFMEDQSDRSPDLPHPYADFRVIHDLEERLSIAFKDGIPEDGQSIRDAARALLAEDTQKRNGGRENV